MIDILVIDNIDSFVYNLVQYLGELGQTIRVELNTVSLEEVKEINPKRIVLSPGPGRPENAGNCIAIIKEFSPKIPILGVCLGHQCIGQAFGAWSGDYLTCFVGGHNGRCPCQIRQTCLQAFPDKCLPSSCV